MTIHYQDKNLFVTYLQIFLKEYLGVTLRRVVPRKKSEKPYYEVTANDPIKVTGYFNAQTYASLALFMAYNYPNEGYPCRWVEETEGHWVSEDYIYGSDPSKTREQNDQELVDIIKTNIENLPRYKDTIVVPERVLSYIFDEVVTPSSSPEEILRIKKMIYSGVSSYDKPLEYHEDLFSRVRKIQESFIEKHTTKGVTYLPDQFKGFKVTGYVDPWTEVLIKGGVEVDE